MSFKRVALFISCLLLAFGGAITAHAKPYSLTGGGGQQAIGQGLPLPPQVFTPGMTKTNFPPLLVPVKPGGPPTVYGTTAMSTRQQLVIPAGVLSLAASSRQVGMYLQNSNLYAVNTNLGWKWPDKQRTLNSTKRGGNNTTTYTTPAGNTIQYSLGSLSGKFGGPARFSISYGATGGWLPNSPVTIYAAPPPAPPPCTHTQLGGANPLCFAVIAGAWPANTGAIGGTTGMFTNTTPQGTPIPGRLAVKAGTSPLGTISATPTPTWTANGNPGFTNQASSYGYPYTAGKIVEVAPFAAGAPETFSITGADNRTAGGAGTIQLVAGSLSQRNYTGPNANRGWVRLVLAEKSQVPSMSPAGIAAAAGLMLLAVGYAVRRRLSK